MPDGHAFGGGPAARNVLGGALLPCSLEPLTGWTRDGCCRTDANDHGSHTVCAVMTASSWPFSKAAGNDLSTPRPEYRFPGLKPGDQWCLCAMRWEEAARAAARRPWCWRRPMWRRCASASWSICRRMPAG
jgi:uncharacterized protein (DUF2237 family)